MIINSIANRLVTWTWSKLERIETGQLSSAVDAESRSGDGRSVSATESKNRRSERGRGSGNRRMVSEIQHNPSFIVADEQCLRTFVLESMNL